MNARKSMLLVLALALGCATLGCKSLPPDVRRFFEGAPPVVIDSPSSAEDLDPMVADALRRIEARLPAELPRKLKIATVCELGDLPRRYERAEGRPFPMTPEQFSDLVFQHLDENRWQTIPEEVVRDIVVSEAGLRYPRDLWNPACEKRLLAALDARERPFDYALVIRLHGTQGSTVQLAGLNTAKWNVQVAARFVRLDVVATKPIAVMSEPGKIVWTNLDANRCVASRNR